MPQVPGTARVGPGDGDQDSLLGAVRRGAPPGGAQSRTSYERGMGRTPRARASRKPSIARRRRRRAGSLRGHRGTGEDASSADDRTRLLGPKPRPAQRGAPTSDYFHPRAHADRQAAAPVVPLGWPDSSSSQRTTAATVARDARAIAGKPAASRRALPRSAGNSSAPPARWHGSRVCADGRQHDCVELRAPDAPPAPVAPAPARPQARRAEQPAGARRAAPRLAGARRAAAPDRRSRLDPPSGELRGGRRAPGPRARRSARRCRPLPPLRSQSRRRPRSIPGERG
jgi:hypothetical protein